MSALQCLLEEDAYRNMRHGLLQVAADRSHYAGIPMPLDDLMLKVEKTYPRGAELMRIGKAAMSSEEENARALAELAEEGTKVRASFYSHRYRLMVSILERDGRVTKAVWSPGSAFQMQVNTIGASLAWGIEQEFAAIETLSEMVTGRKLKQYLLTGAFLERSKRSNVMYVFRRLRPTIAVSMSGPTATPLCAMCMHPIGYYQDSFAGAMCPTDDIIAHLALMRADEVMFWRRCNQHPIDRAGAGL